MDEAWAEFTAPDGRKYYFNSITQENTWEKPKAFADREGKLIKLYMICISKFRRWSSSSRYWKSCA